MLKPFLGQHGGEVAQVEPDGQVVPEEPHALVGDAAHPPGDAVVQFVAQHPVVGVALPRAAHGHDGGEVEEGVEPGPGGRAGAPGAQALVPQARPLPGQPHRLDQRGAVHLAAGDPLGDLRELPQLVGDVGQEVRPRFAVDEGRVDEHQRHAEMGRPAPGTSRGRSGRCWCSSTGGRAWAGGRRGSCRWRRSRGRSGRSRRGRGSTPRAPPLRRARGPSASPSRSRRGSPGRPCGSRAGAASPPGSRW